MDRRKLLICSIFQGIVRRLRRPFIVRSVLISLLGGALVAIPCVLRPPWPSVGADIAVKQDEPGSERERIDPLDDQERRLAEAIVHARESAVALEYATADGPSEARRVATGVVINDAGEVLSIRIDPPPSTAPVVARDAWGRRHPAQWLASDAETGLTLLRIKPGAARPIPAAVHEAAARGPGARYWQPVRPWPLGSPGSYLWAQSSFRARAKATRRPDPDCSRTASRRQRCSGDQCPRRVARFDPERFGPARAATNPRARSRSRLRHSGPRRPLGRRPAPHPGTSRSRIPGGADRPRRHDRPARRWLARRARRQPRQAEQASRQATESSP